MRIRYGSSNVCSSDLNRREPSNGSPKGRPLRGGRPFACRRPQMTNSPGSVQVMGVLNATPDSFSDGGRFASLEAGLAQARRLIGDGADILDVGGESTRPGAAPVDEADELARVEPLIRAFAAEISLRFLSASL